MLALLRVMTLDSASQVYTPLILEGGSPILVYFISALLVLAVLLMNLVTAVIVEQAVDTGNREREVKVAYERSRRQRVAGELDELFAEMDTNNDGQLQLDEILNSELEVLERLGDLFGLPDVSDDSKWPLFCQNIQYLFQDLDIDQSGCVARQSSSKA